MVCLGDDLCPNNRAAGEWLSVECSVPPRRYRRAMAVSLKFVPTGTIALALAPIPPPRLSFSH